MPQNDLIRIGLCGVGAIGRHHARILSEMAGAELVGICDIDTNNATELCQRYGCQYFSDLDSLLDRVEVVFVATPTMTHYEIGRRAIEAGKDVFIEKPLADTVQRSMELVALATKWNRCVVVGHVERFNSVVRWFRENLNPSEVLSINITRVGPRPPRIKDVGIVIDLAVHDIDLVSHLCRSGIHKIQAVTGVTNGSHEDVAQIILKTESGVVSSITTNWLTPYKSRKLEIATRSAFYVGDLIGGSIIKYQALDDTGAKYVVESQTPTGSEPLMEQSKAFLNTIRTRLGGPNASVEEACHTVRLATLCLQ